MRRGRPKRRYFTIAAIILTLAVFALAFAEIFTDKELNFNLEPYRVVASTRDRHTLGSPIVAHLFSGVVLKKGWLAHVLPMDREYPGSEAQALLDRGEAHLALQNADIAIASPQSAFGGLASNAPRGSSSSILTALKKLNLAKLTIHESDIEIFLPGGSRENLSNANLSLQKKDLGVHVAGTALWRGQNVELDLSVGPLDEAQSRLPVALRMQSSNGALNFAGFLVKRDRYALEGHIEITAEEPRALTQLFNLTWPSFAETQKISLTGSMVWSQGSIELDRVALQLDRNKATGALKIKTVAQRPLLSGTLAFDKLNLTPQTSPFQADNALPWSGLQSIVASFWATPVMKLLDADVRLSAKHVQVGTAILSDAAATLSLNDNKLSARLAGLNYKDGSASGQLTVDFNDMFTRTTIWGKLDDAPLSEISRLIVGRKIIDGSADITADLETSGISLKSAIASARGRIQVNQTQSGTVDFDLATLVATASADPGNPVQDKSDRILAQSLKGQTAIDDLSALIEIENGMAQCSKFNAVLDGYTAKAACKLNLQSQHIDLDLLFHRQEAATNPTALRQNEKSPIEQVDGRILALWGPLTDPHLQISAVHGSLKILEHNLQTDFKNRTK